MFFYGFCSKTHHSTTTGQVAQRAAPWRLQETKDALGDGGIHRLTEARKTHASIALTLVVERGMNHPKLVETIRGVYNNNNNE